VPRVARWPGGIRDEEAKVLTNAGRRPLCRTRGGPVRRGAESIPAQVRISHTVEGAIRPPRPASSPWILRYPQAGFSPASRKTSLRMSRRVTGRPGRPARLLTAHPRRSRTRCQRKIVSGVTRSRNPARHGLGITPVSAAINPLRPRSVSACAPAAKLKERGRPRTRRHHLVVPGSATNSASGRMEADDRFQCAYVSYFRGAARSATWRAVQLRAAGTTATGQNAWRTAA
jgi:hypothetical protein